MLKKRLEVPEKHWPLVLKIIRKRKPDEQGGSLHMHEDVYEFKRGRTLSVLYAIGPEPYPCPDWVEIHY